MCGVFVWPCVSVVVLKTTFRRSRLVIGLVSVSNTEETGQDFIFRHFDVTKLPVHLVISATNRHFETFARTGLVLVLSRSRPALVLSLTWSGYALVLVMTWSCFKWSRSWLQHCCVFFERDVNSAPPSGFSDELLTFYRPVLTFPSALSFRCSFGYSGFNCNDCEWQWCSSCSNSHVPSHKFLNIFVCAFTASLLAVVVVSCVLGGIIVIFSVMLAIYSYWWDLHLHCILLILNSYRGSYGFGCSQVKRCKTRVKRWLKVSIDLASFYSDLFHM